MVYIHGEFVLHAKRPHCINSHLEYNRSMWIFFVAVVSLQDINKITQKNPNAGFNDLSRTCYTGHVYIEVNFPSSFVEWI